MTSLPLVERELRLASRRPSTYRTRFWAALVMVAISLCFALATRMPTAQLAKAMLSVLGILAFGYCLLAGVHYTSDCVSEERREGTLGFLFLTDLRGFDVVLGKLAVTSLEAFYGLLAVFPVLSLPLLLGGITGSEFWRLTLVLVNTLFFSLALGMLISVLGQEERHTMLGTLFALLAVAFGLPLLWKGATTVIDSRWFDLVLLLPNPCYAFKLYASGTGDYWLSMVTIFALSAVFIVVSSFLLPRIFQEKIRTIRTQRWADRFHRLRFGKQEHGQAAREIDFRMNPCFWLATRDRLPKVFLRIFILGIIGFGLWSYPVFANKRFNLIGITVYSFFGIHLLLKMLMASEACRRLNEDKRSGALEMLLSTRLKMSDILSGQNAALLNLFGPVMLGILLLDVMWTMWITLINDSELTLMIWGGLAILPFDFYALTWVGAALALRGKRYHRTVLATMGRTLLPPWAAILAFFFMMIGGSSISPAGVKAFFVVWFVASAIYDWALIGWARSQIMREYPRVVRKKVLQCRKLG